MNPQKAISTNIKRIRASRGMSQAEVARSAGISRQAYVDIEKGNTKEPRVSNLQSIADSLDVSMMSLFAEPPQLNTVRFRSNSIKTRKDEATREQCIRDAAFWLRDFNYLQSIVDEKKEYKFINVFQRISRIKNDRPRKAAELARLELGLKDDEPIGDIVGLMESAGIKIRTICLNLKNFFGFSISQEDGGPAIVVNNDDKITVERQIFTVAHELGHLILHPKAYDPSKTRENEKEEKEADIFAGYFLMPQEAFEKKFKESYGLSFVERVLHIKRFFGVSYQVVLHRLSDMGIGDYGKLKAKFLAIYKNRFGKKLSNYEEPIPLAQPDFVEDYLISLVRKALDKEEITFSKAAEVLNVSLMGMREIVNSWADIAA